MKNTAQEVRDSSVVLVLGMHRSGTSLLARIVNLLGVSMGPEEDLFNPENEFNEKGYWENRVVMEMNKEIFRQFNGDDLDAHLPEAWENDKRLNVLLSRSRKYVSSVCQKETSWLFKDPRVTRTLPFWQKALIGYNLKYILSVRDPEAVARSLSRMYNFGNEQGLLLWLSYYLSVLRYLPAEDYFAVEYEDVISDPSDVARRLGVYLGVGGISDKAVKEVESFTDRSLNHEGIRNSESLVIKKNKVDNSKLCAVVSRIIDQVRKTSQLWNTDKEEKDKTIEKLKISLQKKDDYLHQVLSRLSLPGQIP